MNLKFFEDYEKNEIEAYRNKTSILDRFPKLKTPISKTISPGSLLWSQIAFSGTVVFPLHPFPKDVFEKGWNMSINEIPEFVKFAKETKKVQFILTAPPTKYSKLKYLDPIFREFQPPLYTQCELENNILEDLFKSCRDELNLHFDISDKWNYLKLSNGGQNIITNIIREYTLLRHFGFNESADVFIDNIIVEPEFAQNYLSTVYDLFVEPIIDPFKANPSFSLETLQNANQMGISTAIPIKNQHIPEVGSFLLKKTIHYPESLEACKYLISRYEENDLYQVYNALNEAVLDRNQNLVMQKQSEMGEVLENIWTDADLIKTNALTYRTGIEIACGTIGYLFGDLNGGFLSTMGIKTINSIASNFFEEFYELIAKKITTPYLATIYDFKKKMPR